MKKVEHPDIIIDTCMQSGGIFLDRQELNILLTGMSGDIEVCSIDNNMHDDCRPVRKSPAFPNEDMIKVNLLNYSDIILDYCPRSQGFYLDRDELRKSNKELATYAINKENQDYKKYIDNHLVRIEHFNNTYLTSLRAGGMGSVGNQTSDVVNFRVIVFLNTSIHAGLHLYKEKLLPNLFSLLGIDTGIDIQIGDESFDSSFVVSADNEYRARQIFDYVVMSMFLNFNSTKHSLFSNTGNLEMHDDYLIYREGPYKNTGNTKEVISRANWILRDMLCIAKLVETNIPKFEVATAVLATDEHR